MTKKIIVEIAEGLGNQLFMYAHAFSMSKKLVMNFLLIIKVPILKKEYFKKTSKIYAELFQY